MVESPTETVGKISQAKKVKTRAAAFANAEHELSTAQYLSTTSFLVGISVFVIAIYAEFVTDHLIDRIFIFVYLALGLSLQLFGFTFAHFSVRLGNLITEERIKDIDG